MKTCPLFGGNLRFRRLTPYQDRIRALVVDLDRLEHGSTARLHLVRHFKVEEPADTSASATATPDNDGLGLGWHLDHSALTFLAEIGAALDVRVRHEQLSGASGRVGRCRPEAASRPSAAGGPRLRGLCSPPTTPGTQQPIASGDGLDGRGLTQGRNTAVSPHDGRSPYDLRRRPHLGPGYQPDPVDGATKPMPTGGDMAHFLAAVADGRPHADACVLTEPKGRGFGDVGILHCRLRISALPLCLGPEGRRRSHLVLSPQGADRALSPAVCLRATPTRSLAFDRALGARAAST